MTLISLGASARADDTPRHRGRRGPFQRREAPALERTAATRDDERWHAAYQPGILGTPWTMLVAAGIGIGGIAVMLLVDVLVALAL